MADDILTKERILQLFAKLDNKLFAQGTEAKIFVVGGAAIALTVDSTRVTTDIDGQYENLLIDALAAEIASEEKSGVWLIAAPSSVTADRTSPPVRL